jgi:transcriptional regulator with GAF, ATPase, and Fis domain
MEKAGTGKELFAGQSTTSAGGKVSVCRDKLRARPTTLESELFGYKKVLTDAGKINRVALPLLRADHFLDEIGDLRFSFRPSFSVFCRRKSMNPWAPQAL